MSSLDDALDYFKNNRLKVIGESARRENRAGRHQISAAPPIRDAPHPPLPSLPGSFWATSVAGVLAYEWRKPIPTSLKVIHARVIAQGACLAGLAALAAVEA